MKIKVCSVLATNRRNKFIQKGEYLWVVVCVSFGGWFTGKRNKLKATIMHYIFFHWKIKKSTYASVSVMEYRTCYSFTSFSTTGAVGEHHRHLWRLSNPVTPGKCIRHSRMRGVWNGNVETRNTTTTPSSSRRISHQQTYQFKKNLR